MHALRVPSAVTRESRLAPAAPLGCAELRHLEQGTEMLVLEVDLVHWGVSDVATCLTTSSSTLRPQRHGPAVFCIPRGCAGPLHRSPDAGEPVLHLRLSLHGLATTCVTLKYV